MFTHRCPRPRAGDHGATAISYVALLVLAAVITVVIASGVAPGMGETTRAAVCRMFGSDCAPAERPGTQSAPPTRTAQPGTGAEAGDGQRPGDLGGGDFGAGGGKARDFGGGDFGERGDDGPWAWFWNTRAKIQDGVLDALGDEVQGIVDTVKDPGSIVDGLVALWEDPGIIKGVVWDEESQQLADRHEGWELYGRLQWNLGSWFIPGPGWVAKVGKGTKLEKLGRLSKLGKVGELRGLVDDALRRVRQALSKGDLDAAGEAAQDAGELAGRARRESGVLGCKAVSLPPPRRSLSEPVPAMSFGRFGAPVGRAPEGCGDADYVIGNAEQAQRMVKAARVVRILLRIGDPSEAIVWRRNTRELPYKVPPDSRQANVDNPVDLKKLIRRPYLWIVDSRGDFWFAPINSRYPDLYPHRKYSEALESDLAAIAGGTPEQPYGGLTVRPPARIGGELIPQVGPDGNLNGRWTLNNYSYYSIGDGRPIFGNGSILGRSDRKDKYLEHLEAVRDLLREYGVDVSRIDLKNSDESPHR